MATTNKIFIQDGEQTIELTGADKEAFLADRKANAEALALLETEYKAKQDARDSAIKKLAEVAGLTEEEIEGLIR
jgi:hypothetical protein